MSRMRKALQRGTPYRDSYLFIIACEGERTEPEYFERLRLFLRQTRIQIHVVRRQNPASSSPGAVVQSLLDEKVSREQQSRRANPHDQYWAVFDRDEQSWSAAQIHEVITRCQNNDMQYAISNPFFELWIVMHFAADTDVINGFNNDEAIKAFVGLRKNECGGNVDEYFRRITDRLRAAVELARSCGCDQSDTIPTRLCTQVFRLVEQLVSSA